MIHKIINELRDKIDGCIIYLTQYGSHLYGLNTESSDLDFRGVFIPSKKSLFLKEDLDEFNIELYKSSSDNISSKFDVNEYSQKIDIKLFSIYKFLKLCSKADTNSLDVLFSVDMNISSGGINTRIPQYYNLSYKQKDMSEQFVIQFIRSHVDKLINSHRLESPCIYAFKQATKYSIKGTRYKILMKILEAAINYYNLDSTSTDVTIEKFVADCTSENLQISIKDYFDDKYLKIDELNNKGYIEKYLYICGVYHQFNLQLKVLIERLKEKLEKEYTSQRTKDALDGNDWKALSHAVRILFEMQELFEDKTIVFPCKCHEFLKNIKEGKIDRQKIDNLVETSLDKIVSLVLEDPLKWKYDTQFWQQFIINLYDDFLLVKMLHLKTGDEYRYLGEVINCTNGYEDQSMILYKKEDLHKLFVREKSEFFEKFEKME